MVIDGVFKTENSLPNENDYYFVEAGQKISLTFLSSVAGTNPNPSCKWYVLTSNDNFTAADLDKANDVAGGFILIDGQTDKVLSFTPQVPDCVMQ